MSARASFKQGDLVRACNAAKAAGLSVARIEINDNGAVVIVGDPEGKGPRRKKNLADELYGPQA